MTTTPTIDLSKLHLDKGGHDNRDQGVCLLEAAAWWAGEPHSDGPACVSTVLATFGVRLNDVLPDDRRQQLVPLVPRLPGTADDGLDETRSYMALDWLIRTWTPTWLELGGLTEEARKLRELRRIVDLVAAEQAGPVVREARTRGRRQGRRLGRRLGRRQGRRRGRRQGRRQGRSAADGGPVAGLGDRPVHRDDRADRRPMSSGRPA